MTPNGWTGPLAPNHVPARRMSEADITEEDVTQQVAPGLRDGPSPLVVLGTHLNLH